MGFELWIGFFRFSFCRKGTVCRTHEKSSEEVGYRIIRTLNTGERSIEEVRLIVRVVCRGVEDAEEGCIECVQWVVKIRIKVPLTADIGAHRMIHAVRSPHFCTLAGCSAMTKQTIFLQMKHVGGADPIYISRGGRKKIATGSVLSWVRVYKVARTQWWRKLKLSIS